MTAVRYGSLLFALGDGKYIVSFDVSWVDTQPFCPLVEWREASRDDPTIGHEGDCGKEKRKIYMVMFSYCYFIAIGLFRVLLCLCFKRSLSAKPFL